MNETGLYDVFVTPSGKFRRWQSTGTVECMAGGNWTSIPEPAQAEIKRVRDLVLAEREACAKIAEAYAMEAATTLEHVIAEDVQRLHDQADSIASAIRAREKE